MIKHIIKLKITEIVLYSSILSDAIMLFQLYLKFTLKKVPLKI
jgi:hypothetical protein